ncbi:XdhC family protein [Roseateles noduli]|uniref:XdhC family protein n=1 Tax=Roseateles noduli TaxID=2052484 RepID=UPI003D65C854
MESLDLEVLRACAAWVGAGKRCQLVTVVNTWGSSPRTPGAMLGVCEDGSVVGSVSGGCIEDDLIAGVRDGGIEQRPPRAVVYGISSEDAHKFGLPCGGTIRLVIETLSLESRLDELLALLVGRGLVRRRLRLSDGSVVLEHGSGTENVVELDDNEFSAVMGPRWRLLVIGAGDLSKFLAQVATGVGYQVYVCDPRIEYTKDWNLEGVELVPGMPDDVVIDLKVDFRTAVIALTHDPKLDDLALMEALRSDAFYVGAIGSRRNSARRRGRLKLFDLTDAQVDRLRGPIGLPLGGKTPAEIAISALAELTAAKNGSLERFEQLRFEDSSACTTEAADSAGLGSGVNLSTDPTRSSMELA